MITVKKLPHTVSLNAVKDSELRKIIMQLNGNVSSLAGQVAELQRVVIEMQRKRV